MRPNLLLVGCLGAALLPLSAGGAAPTSAPVPDAAPLTAQKAAEPPPSPSVPLPDADAGQAKPLPHTEPASPLPSLPVRTAQAKPLPLIKAAQTKPLVHIKAVQAPPALITKSAPAPVRPAAIVSKPKAAAPAAVPALPDYGGRDGITGAAYAVQPSPALNPLAQAGRAFEALVIVLALVVGGLYGLKRSGVLKADGSASGPMPLLAAVPGFLKPLKPGKTSVPAPGPAEASASPWFTMIGSQPLPNVPGASLHLVSVGGKTLLLGATAQSVLLISEVDGARQAEHVPTMDTGQMPSAFDGFLMQADQSPLRQSNETELLMSATTMRLQAMIARSEAESGTHRA